VSETEDMKSRVERWSGDVGIRPSRSLCPLYKRGTHVPQLVGTGTMIRVSKLVLIATAAHVVEDLGHGECYVGTSQLSPMPARRLVNDLGAAAERRDDRLDLGCIAFDVNQSAEIGEGEALLLSDLDLSGRDSPQNGDSYFLSGYPASRQPRKLLSNGLDAHNFNLLTTERSPEQYGQAGLDRHLNLFVGYDKDELYYSEKRSVGPDLDGVSGGAIWRLEGDNSVSYAHPKLSAIATAWRRQSEPHGVIGTWTILWLQLAARIFPNEFVGALDALARDETV